MVVWAGYVREGHFCFCFSLFFSNYFLLLCFLSTLVWAEFSPWRPNYRLKNEWRINFQHLLTILKLVLTLASLAFAPQIVTLISLDFVPQTVLPSCPSPSHLWNIHKKVRVGPINVSINLYTHPPTHTHVCMSIFLLVCDPGLILPPFLIVRN